MRCGAWPGGKLLVQLRHFLFRRIIQLAQFEPILLLNHRIGRQANDHGADHYSFCFGHAIIFITPFTRVAIEADGAALFASVATAIVFARDGGAAWTE